MSKTWIIMMVAVMLVMDAVAFHHVFYRLRPRLMKLGRTLAQRKETIAAAATIVGACLRESYSGDPDTLPRGAGKARQAGGSPPDHRSPFF